MKSIPDAQGMLALDRTLAQILANHPGITPNALCHGLGEGFAMYLDAVRDAGCVLHHSTTEEEFAAHIEALDELLIVLVVYEVLPKPFNRIFASTCEKFEPLYLIKIETCFGIDPQNNHRSIITSFCSEVYADTPACKRVSHETYKAFDIANAEALGIDEKSYIDLDNLLSKRKSKDRPE